MFINNKTFIAMNITALCMKGKNKHFGQKEI